jgi:hypothetical protein
MSDWENAACLLCGKRAKKHVYDGPRGGEYNECTGGCPHYATAGSVHYLIEIGVDPEGRGKIIDLIKNKSAALEDKDDPVIIEMEDLYILGLRHRT